MPSEPKEFSREIENLIADLREVPTDDGRSRRRPTQELGALVEALLIKHRVGRDSIEHELRARWSELVGAANASFSHPLTIERNQLIVLVSHAVVRNELFLHRAGIVAKLRALPGCAEIKSIHLRSS
ncbi:MAG TPA: DUF721 domain-containing protein [Candidatus Didemnitutus sp.]|nr:DUF721 domain-containing protein [Candidatus Didemnitutus sp.]